MQNQQGTDQPPVFICATASNDWATGLAFPAGNAYCLLFESWLGSQERQAMVNTIGHLSWLKTHDLAGISAAPGYQLIPASPEAQWNPFWVVRAAPAIINGHNGIFLPPFLRFVADQVFAHVETTRSKRQPTTMR
jgi:hypothetical protein